MAHGELALIPYDAANETNSYRTPSYTAADALNLKRARHTSPQELIMHESIRNLIAEVAELRGRCNNLETANAELTSSMHTLEQAYCNELVRAPLTKANLTGYASSHASSTRTPSEEGHATGDRQAAVDQRFAAVAEILDNYNQRLSAQTAQQEKLEKTISELAAYKRSSEALFSALKHELNGLDDAAIDPDCNAFFGRAQKSLSPKIAIDFVDKHDRLEGRFNTFEQRAEETKASVGELKERLETVAEALKAGMLVSNAASAAGLVSADNPSPHGSIGFEKDVQGEIKLLHERQDLFEIFEKAMLRRIKQEQIVDDAPTKEALYGMFKDIESISVSDGKRRRCGQFKGTFDELWPLRDRIIYRLTLFDAYGVAFDEAKKAAKDLN